VSFPIEKAPAVWRGLFQLMRLFIVPPKQVGEAEGLLQVLTGLVEPPVSIEALTKYPSGAPGPEDQNQNQDEDAYFHIAEAEHAVSPVISVQPRCRIGIEKSKAFSEKPLRTDR
jgi:hypothetical protein